MVIQMIIIISIGNLMEFIDSKRKRKKAGYTLYGS